MTFFDRGIEIVMTVVLIVGGYQFYFWAQRRRWFAARYLETRWDDRITYNPHWVWIYSGLYYPMIVLAALSLPSWPAFANAVGGFLALLGAQMCFFILLPVEIPQSWRVRARRGWEGTLSQSFMDTVWSYDKLRNSMPSMHVSVATMVDLTIWREWPTIGHAGVLFPVLIAISALKTKQHYIVDVVPGALMGGAVFAAWYALVGSAS